MAASIENDCNDLHVRAKVVSAVRSNLPLPELKSNALVAFTREMVANRGHVEAQTIENFLTGGYREDQILWS